MAQNTLTKIGKYDVVEVLGKGGMGIVYKATDSRIGRLVAIKMMTGGFAENPDLLKLKSRSGHGHQNTIVNGIARIGWMTGGNSARWVDEDMADIFTGKAIAFIEQPASDGASPPPGNGKAKIDDRVWLKRVFSRRLRCERRHPVSSF